MRFLAVVPLLAAASALAAVSAVDSDGRRIRLEQPARRIVSLAPHATEQLFAAGAGGRLVAVSEYSDYPPEATRLPQVASAAAVDLERILALKPDLVVAWRLEATAPSLARLEALARRRYSQPDPQLKVGPLEIDTAAKTVTRSGEAVPLTAREFSLLEVLARYTRAVRDSPAVDARSGVSARFAIAAAETVAAAALRRAGLCGEAAAVARIGDTTAVTGTLRGKVEFDSGEEGREGEILAHLLRVATAETFREMRAVILERAKAVAHAAGGILGVGSVMGTERDALKEIEKALGPK